MTEFSSRTALLLGEKAVELLKTKRVAVFGVGGVGGFAVEALARAGVGNIDVVDNDNVSESNLNRQIIALRSTVGRKKTDVIAERIGLINPECNVQKHDIFFVPETADCIDFSNYDYVIDAIDTVAGKLEIIKRAKEKGVPVITSMGAGNKLNPLMFKVTDIFETRVCPLARVMRSELRKLKITDVKAVWSEEEPKEQDQDVLSVLTSGENTKKIPGSVSFVPSVVGLVIAGEVIKDLVYKGESNGERTRTL